MITKYNKTKFGGIAYILDIRLSFSHYAKEREHERKISDTMEIMRIPIPIIEKKLEDITLTGPHIVTINGYLIKGYNNEDAFDWVKAELPLYKNFQRIMGVDNTNLVIVGEGLKRFQLEKIEKQSLLEKLTNKKIYRFLDNNTPSHKFLTILD